MPLIGYARVSTQDQHLHLQQDALRTAGCIKIFTDTVSGAKHERKGLEDAMNFLREGDILIAVHLSVFEPGGQVLGNPSPPLFLSFVTEPTRSRCPERS